MKLICPICGKEFSPNGTRQIYCSLQCKRRQAYYKKLERQGVMSKVRPERDAIYDCPRPDCKYHSVHESPKTCNYILIAKKPRGCEIKNCTRWKE